MKIITILTDIIHKSIKFIKPIIPILLLLVVLLIIVYLFSDYLNLNNNEGFVSDKPKVFESNKFQQITLPDIKNYDIELAIPAGQILHSTVQGNWGISTDADNEGMTIGVFRDGYSADGSIFKGKNGKLFKRMLEQGPYVLKYEIRDGKDIKIYVNNKKIHDLKNQAVPSGKLKVIGTNYHNYNDIAEETGRGRREIDYIKFTPKQMKEGFIGIRKNNWSWDQEGMENLNISKSQLNEAMKTVKANPEIVKEIGAIVMEQMNNHKSKSKNSHPQLQQNLMEILNNTGLGNMPQLSFKEGMIAGQSNTQNNVNRVLHKNELCGPASNIIGDNSEYKYKKGYSCTGRALGDYKASKNDCIDKCKETNACKCVTYFPQKSTKKCRLESGTKATFRGKNVPYFAHVLADNIDNNIGYPKCKKECNKNKKCNAIRWREKNKRCDLMSKCDTKTNKEGWNTMTFMAKDPKIERTRPQPEDDDGEREIVQISEEDYKNQLKMKAELKEYFKKNHKISKRKMMEIGNKYKPDHLTLVKENIFLKYVDMVFSKGPINKTTAEQLMGGSLDGGPEDRKKFFQKEGPNKPHKKLSDKSAFEKAVEAATKQLGKIREGFLA